METHPPSHRRASTRAVVVIAALLICLFAAIFFLGFLPKRDRTRETVEAAREEAHALPTVIVETAKLADRIAGVTLPGNIQAITETPILARAEGYLVKRYSDIGDRRNWISRFGRLKRRFSKLMRPYHRHRLMWHKRRPTCSSPK
jgi:hypothetical protein